MNQSQRKKKHARLQYALTTALPATPIIESDDAQFMRDREYSALGAIRAAAEESQATISRVVRDQLEQLDWHKDQISKYRLEAK